MTSTRPTALVTAAVSGPGLDLLDQLADLVARLVARPAHAADLQRPSSWPSGWQRKGPSIVVVESDRCAGPCSTSSPLVAVASCRGDPNNVDVAAATAAGVPGAAGTGPQRRRGGRAGRGPALRRHPRRRGRRTGTCATGQIYRDGTIPYQRYRAWELAGRTAGLVGLGAVGRALRWRLRGLGLEVLAYDPYAADATSTLDQLLARSDVISVHAPVTERDHRDDRLRRSSPRCATGSCT